MSFSQVCNEHMSKYVWPTLQRHESPEELERLQKEWDETHMKRLQGWKSCNSDIKVETLGFVARNSYSALNFRFKGSRPYDDLEGLLGSVHGVIGRICGAVPQDDSYFGRVRGYCFAFYKQWMDNLQKVAKALERMGSEGLSPHVRDSAISSLRPLEALAWRWWRVVLGRGATDKWLPEWFRDMQKLRQALLNFPCHEKNPVKIVPWSIVEWNAVCLNTPLVILAHLSLALDGVRNGEMHVEKQVLAWLDRYREALEKYKPNFNDAELNAHFITLTAVLEQLNKLQVIFIEQDVEVELIRLQEKLRDIGKKLLAGGARDAFSRVLSKDMGNLKLDSSSCTVPEYQLSLQLRTAVLALGAHWVLTCHDRDIPQAAGGRGSAGGSKAQDKEEHYPKSTTKIAKPGEKKTGGDPAANIRKSEVDPEVWAAEEVARPTITSRWEVEEVQVVLDYYAHQAAEDLKKQGMENQAPYKVVADFLRVLPEVKALGRSLSAGQPSDQIGRVVAEDKTGDGNGESFPTLIKGLAGAAHAALPQGACHSIVRDMVSFCETAQSLAQPVGTHEDPAAKRRRLQKLGFTLLDMAKLACRLIKLLLQEMSAFSSQAPVLTP